MRPVILVTLILFFSGWVAAANEAGVESDAPAIAIIGTGDMADSLGPRLAKAGYTVIYGSRDPQSAGAKAIAAATGPGARVTSPAEAVRQAEIVALAIPWSGIEASLQGLGKVGERIVIDMLGAYRQGDDGYPVQRWADATTASAAEYVQARLPAAKVVKTFATAGSNIIDNPLAAGGIVSMPLASDHREAKERVAQMVAELGFEPVDFGPLRMARHIESLQAVWLTPAFQRKNAGYELYLRRSVWPCEWNLDAWSKPAYDADNLAQMPGDNTPEPACN
jgi:predicted dinucleotide-binding enzyme